MKFLKLTFAAVFALAFGDAYAFHSGGVAECEGCHSMHNSLENLPNVEGRAQFSGARYLLKANDQSGACLNCHNSPDSAPSSYHVSTDASKLGPGLPPVEMTPGGDFAWLKKTYTFFVRGSPNVAHGERHGHNIVAADFGYVPDSTLMSAPGGNALAPYPAAGFNCISCHDPHGRYRRDASGAMGTPNGMGSGMGTVAAGATVALPIFNSGSYDNSKDPITNVSAVGAYRILAGRGYVPRSVDNVALAFTADPPVAISPSTYNRSEAKTQTVVAYGSGMSEWCGNCHPQMHQEGYMSGDEGLKHPSGNGAFISAAIVANYNAYTTSGRLGGTGGAAAYSTLAPFETGQGYAALKPLAKIDGSAAPVMTSSARVMCLSCHRAHASGFESMTRFFRNNEFMTVADASNNGAYDNSVTEGKINYGKTSLEQQYAYQGRPASAFGPYARNYCNKCHAKD